MTSTPPLPAAFTPEAAPRGVEVNYASYWQERARIKPRIQLCHTNAATTPGSIEASRRWIESAPGVHTFPHYQVDRDGRACKFLPTNRKGIANQTVSAYRGDHGTVQDWSLAYETADTGTLADPTISDYTDAQAETLAGILAYESIVHAIPLEIPAAWYGSGTASHTDPFGYPYWTNAAGKTCPGAKKKARLRTEILPRARVIRAVWLGPPAPPTDEDDTMTEDQERKLDDVAQAVQNCFTLIQQLHGKADQTEQSVQVVFDTVGTLGPKGDDAIARLADIQQRIDKLS